jgi:hypothetical protein
MDISILKRAIFSAFTCTILISCASLIAKEPLRMEVSPAGYKFHSSYKLYIPSESGSPSVLKVNMIAGPDTRGSKSCCEGKLIPAFFMAELNFNLKGVPAHVEARYDWRRRRAIEKSNITSDSEWYPGIKKIFHKVIDKQYDKFVPWVLKERKSWRQVLKAKAFTLPKKSPSIHVKALPGCKLESTYSIHVRSKLPKSSGLAPSIKVNFTVKPERVATLGYKKVLTVTAAFCTKRIPHSHVPDSIIKFAQTENGLQEIGRIDLEKSSAWYPWIKRVAASCAVRYEKLKAIHDKTTSKSLRDEK